MNSSAGTTSAVPAIDADGPRRTPAEFDLSCGWDPSDPEERFAPAYAVLAALLVDGEWHRWSEIAAHMAPAQPDADAGDLRRFFQRVARQGWLTEKNIGGNDRPWRVTAAGAMLRPELRGRAVDGTHPWRAACEHAAATWMTEPRLPATAPALSPEPLKTPKTPKIVHPSDRCKCGNGLVYKEGVSDKTNAPWAKWQCPDYRYRGAGSTDPNHDMKWVP